MYEGLPIAKKPCISETSMHGDINTYERTSSSIPQFFNLMS